MDQDLHPHPSAPPRCLSAPRRPPFPAGATSFVAARYAFKKCIKIVPNVEIYISDSVEFTEIICMQGNIMRSGFAVTLTKKQVYNGERLAIVSDLLNKVLTPIPNHWIEMVHPYNGQ